MRRLLFLSCLVFLLGACGNDDYPECIIEKMDAFELDDTVCETDASGAGLNVGGNVVTFNFRGQTVYCFNWGSCNPRTIEIWTEECDLLCELAGPNDITVCDGVPWADNAEELDVLYQN